MTKFENIRHALISVESLREMLDCDPVVEDIALDGSNNRRMLIVWLVFLEQFVTRFNVVNAVRMTVRLLLDQSLLKNFGAVGVGIVSGANHFGEGRVIVVGVDKSAWTSVQSLGTVDFQGREGVTSADWLANSTPIEGVRISWHRNPANMPAG
ncbi:MAG TPA: hypothetical protein VGN12_19080 [Pirellulales bacterium]